MTELAQARSRGRRWLAEDEVEEVHRREEILLTAEQPVVELEHRQRRPRRRRHRRHVYPYEHKDVPAPRYGRATSMFRERFPQWRGERGSETVPVAMRVPQYGFVSQFGALYTDEFKFYYYKLPASLTRKTREAWMERIPASCSGTDDLVLLYVLIPRSLPRPAFDAQTLDFPRSWLEAMDTGEPAAHDVWDVSTGQSVAMTIVVAWAGLPSERRRHVAVLLVRLAPTQKRHRGVRFGPGPVPHSPTRRHADVAAT